MGENNGVTKDVGIDDDIETSVPPPAAPASEVGKEEEKLSNGLPDVVVLGPARSLQRLAMAMGSKLTARAALKQQLRKKVIVTATENYCKQQHIQTAELKLRMDVTEKCRQVDLVVLIFMC